MAPDPVRREHVPPPMVKYDLPVRERRARMYDAGPLKLDDFMTMLRRNGYALFRQLNAVLGIRTSHKKLGNKTR